MPLVVVIVVALSVSWGHAATATIPFQVDLTLDRASVRTDKDLLIASTGRVERRWRWTGHGLVTVSLRDLDSSREWATAPAITCDWSLPGLIGEQTEAKLTSLTCREDDDEGFTSRHLAVMAEITYPDAKLVVRYIVWVYPDAPGLRCQLRARGMPGFSAERSLRQPARVDYMPISLAGTSRRAIGYYNDTQHRNSPDKEILREQTVTGEPKRPERFGWASILCVETPRAGVCLVKESHKCVNQSGVHTGAFHTDATGVWSSGWGLSPKDVVVDRFGECWASWCVVCAGGDVERQRAIKVFDRYRYPVDPKRDLFIMANTWGSSVWRRDGQLDLAGQVETGESNLVAKQAARKDHVLREIASQDDLGIDVQQIDDGWQGDDYRTWRPAKHRYPQQSWDTVKAAAAKHGVKLGLWAAVRIPEKDLLWNYDHGGFRYYKLDFANLRSRTILERVLGKARRLILHSGHTVRVNWDVTENAPRVGYFFAREYGNIYLANRKRSYPRYVPSLILRDAWQIARYCNLNKFQITVQNIDLVNPRVTDAQRHNHAYCVAITLMGSPIFFQLTQHYTEQARAQIRPLLAVYKRHRAEMFRGYVFPIGEKPDNASWAGFQCYVHGSGVGYLTLFRELHNEESSRAVRLHFLSGKTLTLQDLCSGETQRVPVAPDGHARFQIPRPAGFRFYCYETKGS